jgi:DMSO/TMAO reductase YedYZ molybdopterin-dependent catalytic subunit
VDRRRFLAAVAAAAGTVGVSYLGSIVSPLRALAVLAPRRSDAGPQGLPVNKTASQLGVATAARDPAYRLEVVGAVERPLRLGLGELRARADREADLPIACVEGWSVGARWRGVPVRVLLAEAGARPFTQVVVRSLQRRGPYGGGFWLAAAAGGLVMAFGVWGCSGTPRPPCRPPGPAGSRPSCSATTCCWRRPCWPPGGWSAACRADGGRRSGPPW